MLAELLRHPPSPGPLGRAIAAAQAIYLTLRLCYRHHIGDRSAALAFATVMSMLPILLIALASLDALGVSQPTRAWVRHRLVSYFLPETASNAVAALEMSLDVFAARSGTVRITGGLLLLVAAGQLLGTLNRVFQGIWGTHGLKARLPRFVGFWLLVLAGPGLLALSAYLNGLLGEDHPESAATRVLTSFAAGFLVVLIAYLFLPGRRVRLRPAVIGALCGAALWQVLKTSFAALVKTAFVANAVLAALGLVPALLLWLYLSWTGFLFGAELVFVLSEYDAALRRAEVE